MDVGVTDKSGPVFYGLCSSGSVSTPVSKSELDSDCSKESISLFRNCKVKGILGKGQNVTTASHSGTVDVDQFSSVYFFACGSDSLHIGLNYHFVNPGGQELSTTQVPYLTVAPVLAIAWGGFVGLWGLLLWVRRPYVVRLHTVMGAVGLAFVLKQIATLAKWRDISKHGWELLGWSSFEATASVLASTSVLFLLCLVSKGWGMTRRHLEPEEMRSVGAVLLIYAAMMGALKSDVSEVFFFLFVIVLAFVVVVRILFRSVADTIRFILFETRVVGAAYASGRNISSTAQNPLFQGRMSDTLAQMQYSSSGGPQSSASREQGGSRGIRAPAVRAPITDHGPDVRGAPWASTWWSGVQQTASPSSPSSASRSPSQSSSRRDGEADETLPGLDDTYARLDEESPAAPSTPNHQQPQNAAEVRAAARGSSAPARAFGEFATRMALAGTGLEDLPAEQLPQTPMRQLRILYSMRTVLVFWVATDCIIHVFNVAAFSRAPWVKLIAEDVAAAAILAFFVLRLLPHAEAPIIPRYATSTTTALSSWHSSVHQSDSYLPENDDLVLPALFPDGVFRGVLTREPKQHPAIINVIFESKSETHKTQAYPPPSELLLR